MHEGTTFYPSYLHSKAGYKEKARNSAKIACSRGFQVLSFDLASA